MHENLSNHLSDKQTKASTTNNSYPKRIESRMFLIRLLTHNLRRIVRRGSSGSTADEGDPGPLAASRPMSRRPCGHAATYRTHRPNRKGEKEIVVVVVNVRGAEAREGGLQIIPPLFVRVYI